MQTSLARLAAVATFACAVLAAPDASALLLDMEMDIEEASHSDDLVYFFPYRTSYRQVDRRYAFDDDPLSAFAHEPYEWNIKLYRTAVRRPMSGPRTSFVREMSRSTEGI